MSRLDLDEAAVSIHDASSFFSEEEWKLLQEWQKDLYRSVMKEVHQALVLLGPLIVTTVCSLRVKENEEKQERCTGSSRWITHPTSDTAADPDLHFAVSHAAPQHANHAQDSERRQHHERLKAELSFCKLDAPLGKAEAAVPVLIGRLDAEIGERRADLNSESEVVASLIKDEEDAYCIDNPGKGTQGSSCPTDDPIKNRKRRKENSATNSEPIPDKGPSEEDRVKVFDSPESEARYNHPTWEPVAHRLGEVPTSTCESAFGTLVHLDTYAETPNMPRLEQYDDREINTSHAEVQGQELYACLMCDKNFTKKETLFRHRRIHMGVRPYQCTDCGKSFIRNDNLIVHMRTHTGERPYHCNTCPKSFSQKGILSRHVLTHIGERPYHCKTCAKSFSQKGILSRHALTHIGERPYHCSTCARSFSQKGILSQHKLTHIGERPYKCTECEKSFTRKGNLLTHQKRHS
ncbi:zinc finger protein interacting with ribonucleoprotein K-like [Ambystoma mexicanum]|uniref:zinc finger protein interacting with ribonucleoprotein K-like n=1 Tax=Ambystoma mexicanum TaxID=8296 RepID=UPI0037E8C294